MSQQWYCRRGNSRSGPFTDEDLKRMADSGELLATDLLRSVGMTEWFLAGEIRGLFTPPSIQQPALPQRPAAMPRTQMPVPPPLPSVGMPGPPPQMSQVPSRHVQPPPVQSPPMLPTAPAFEFRDDNNPYAGFGLEPMPQTAMQPGSMQSTPMEDYNPFATMNQQDILALSAAQEVEASRQARSSQGYSTSPSRGPSNLRTIASNQRRMILLFLVYILSIIPYMAMAIMFGQAVTLEEGAEMSPISAIAILVLYMVGFISSIGTLFYVGKLASSLGRSAVLNVLGCFIPFGGLIIFFMLNSEATSKLRSAGYRIGFLGINPNRVR